MDEPAITPELVIRAYCAGAFPMADSRDGDVGWYQPVTRGLLPVRLERERGDGGLHVPRSLRKAMHRSQLTITRDEAFDQVIRACAEPRPQAEDTWINNQIIAVYIQLHRAGIGHSVEAWDGDDLVGGVYGLALGSAFFGESMFSRQTNASKICLVHLVEHLGRQGYTLLDAQMSNPHLEQFGLKEVPHQRYMDQLEGALTGHAIF